MQTLVEDFLQYLRHERGQSDNTAKTYAAMLDKFTCIISFMKGASASG
jgi:site-specific recombinase XerD